MKIVETIKSRKDENGVASIAAKEVATIIRAKLKAAFPGVKFSVRSDYNSVDIYWTDGPTQKDVEAVTDNYSFGGFDGTIDLAYSSRNWLLPNGDMIPAESSGTVGSGGCYHPYATDCPAPGAFIVKHGPRYVFCHRKISDERWRELITEMAEEHGIEVDHSQPYHNQRAASFGGEYLPTLAYQYEQKTGLFYDSDASAQ